jgi:hypothetical protein
VQATKSDTVRHWNYAGICIKKGRTPMINLLGRTKHAPLAAALLLAAMPGRPQTKVSLRQLEANGFSSGCVVATSGVLSTQACGSAGDAGGYSVLSFSSTPVFPVTKNTGQSWLLTLAGDVTTSTVDTSALTNSGRPIVTLRLCQDQSGAHAFAWPASVLNHGTVDPHPGSCSTQTFVFDGTNFQALGNLLVTGAGADGITLPGSTSGATTIQASPTAGGTLTLPPRTATVATTAGSLASGHCAQYDASGNLTDAGAGCAGGGGAGPFLTTNLSANLSLSGAGGYQNLTWSGTVEDTSAGSMWSSAHGDRMIAPAAGHYQADCAAYDINNTNYELAAQHYSSSGVLDTAMGAGTASAASLPPATFTHVSWTFPMLAGDWLVCAVYLNTGQNPNFNRYYTFGQMKRLGN